MIGEKKKGEKKKENPAKERKKDKMRMLYSFPGKGKEKKKKKKGKFLIYKKERGPSVLPTEGKGRVRRAAIGKEGEKRSIQHGSGARGGGRHQGISSSVNEGGEEGPIVQPGGVK